jgi:hypothetical protein
VVEGLAGGKPSKRPETGLLPYPRFKNLGRILKVNEWEQDFCVSLNLNYVIF